MHQMFHMLSVDVEDWPQSTLDHSLPIGQQVVMNTYALLDLMSESGQKATFFILGKVAERYPQLSRDIASAGHEVGTHGFSHEAIESLPLPVFREELHRSVDVLRQQIGQPIVGHRAADFSISSQSLHLIEELADEGLKYDSSIFPVRHPRYGVPGAWRYPHKVQCISGRTIVEFPPATVQMGQMVLPGAGGGYLRIFPYWWTNHTIRNMEQEGYPATCYMHPYEINPKEMKEIPYRVPPFLRMSQGLNRRSVKRKLRKLLSSFQLKTMAEGCEILERKGLPLALDLSETPYTYKPQAA